MSYDIIGDIHGQDAKLQALLAKLGYRVKDGAYRNPEGRVALFLGDLIDRGPGQVESLRIVRNMIEAGSARTIMGNHELNAIGYATKNPDGPDYLRPRGPKNKAQHAEFLRQVGENSALHQDLVGWFKTLPPYLDLGEIRLSHARWNQDFVDLVGENLDADGTVSEEFLLAAFKEGTAAKEAMDGLTKGLEVDLPNGASFLDYYGTERRGIRVRWWDENATSYRAAAMAPEDQRERIPDEQLPNSVAMGCNSDVPIFLGHYWLTGKPAIQSRKVAILDYGAATTGPLVAYRWNGESELSDDGFVMAGA